MTTGAVRGARDEGAGIGVGVVEKMSVCRGFGVASGSGFGLGFGFASGSGFGLGFGVASGSGGLGVPGGFGVGVASGARVGAGRTGFGLGFGVASGEGVNGSVFISSRAFRNCFRFSASLWSSAKAH